MAERLLVKTDLLERCASDLKSAANGFGDAASILASLNTSQEWWHKIGGFSALRLQDEGSTTSMGFADNTVHAMASVLRRYNSRAETLGNKIAWAAELFASLEDQLSAKISAQSAGEENSATNGEYAEANSARVFDSEGQYGSDQGSPTGDKSRYDLYRDIIERNTGKRLNDRQLKKYLDRLNSEGCGYSCIVNSIFRAYEGRAEEFERTFGFSMYNNGDLDYNRLLVDVYSKTDNHNLNSSGVDEFSANEDREGFFEEKNPWYNAYTDKDGYGTTTDMISYRTQLYLDSYGVNSKVTTYSASEVTVENFAEMSKNGEVQVLIGRPFTIHNTPTSTGENSINGGHWMTITGVENGRFVVSSWGQTYYLDPNDSYGFCYFQTVEIG